MSTHHNDLDKMIGKVITRIDGCESGSERIEFVFDDGVLVLKHDQDCCETVSVVDVCGDPKDLIGQVVTEAREDSNEEGEPKPEYPDSWTWTFYNIRTMGGDLTIRWLGESNGYYSEDVDAVWCKPGQSFSDARWGR